MSLVIEEKFYKVSDGTLIAAKIVGCKNFSYQYTFILYHGGSFNHKRYINLAKNLTKRNIKTILLDMRGHGDSEGMSGTTKYVGQLEDDFNDILVKLRAEDPSSYFLAGGHSSGAIVILRHLQKYGSKSVQGYVLISPALTAPEFIRYPALAQRLFYYFIYHRTLPCKEKMPDSYKKHIPVLNIWKYMLCRFMPFLRNKLNIVSFPGESKMALLEKRVLNYKYNMVASCSLDVNYAHVFLKLNRPTLIIIGQDDEIIDYSYFKNFCSWNTISLAKIDFVTIPASSHLSVCHQADAAIANWINNDK